MSQSPGSKILNSFLDYKMTPYNSIVWKSMIKGKFVNLDRLAWVVGTGANMSVLKDNWVPGVPPSRLLSGLKSSL